MKWLFDAERWTSYSQARNGLEWRIVVTMDGKFSVAASDHGLAGRDEPFETLADAKQFCMSHETAYLVFSDEKDVKNMVDFSSWKRDNLERVANEMLSKLVEDPNDRTEVLNLLLLRANVKQQIESMDGYQEEQKWADHYHEKLVEARKRGFLPDDFLF
jgi:hypothetical protein